MFVSASTTCFPELSSEEVLGRLVDLQFTAVELALHEKDGWLAPSAVAADLERAINVCGDTRRLDVAALSLEIEATGDAFYEQFEACCKLAKAIKVATLVVPSSEIGTPFNEEIERLKKMTAIAAFEGAVVALKTQVDCMTQDPDTAAVFCDHVKGLGVTLDPSCFLYGESAGRQYDKLLPYVRHVHLRDTSKESFQVRVGQGEVDYGRLVTQLSKEGYNRALSIEMQPLEGFEHSGEMRKLRLLIDSLL
ncbi:Xylose isomerase-like TIM barrel [Pseudobythopirellula maris]|uniref:Xylose isomerase-like TIM barrel n=1 Tax=Pseudobythopirellula maris TaxID=2527991 RepID=A0A5C5ZU76_9BACT|nr:sugar phosphate isomerase/epimerase [Pseudobythopirellula maris]TWT91134.1 Xylose isomerase-like TIM barrel [Pseudobythopirellula maris]